jgi:hypothetical protein
MPDKDRQNRCEALATHQARRSKFRQSRTAGRVVGRVPFVYYIAHIYLIHLVAVAAAALTGADLVWLFRNPIMTKPAGFGVSLPSVYVLWLGIVFALYPLCRWFAALKQRRKDWWLSYL